MFSAKILADSEHPNGSRLTTMELTYPRVIHSEFMTHRMFSRNAASSRAIPIKKMMQNIKDDPFIPLVWGLNQAGMQAGREHHCPDECERRWLNTRDDAVTRAEGLHMLGLHKQIVNRVLEPFMWITVVATGVDHAWENFFKLRCAGDAEPHIQKIAYMARELFDDNAQLCDQLGYGEYHLPLTGFPGDELLDSHELIKVSVARCARVSYLTHDGTRDVAADIELYERLRAGGHWSPFEHVASTCNSESNCDLSNFGVNWMQHRKTHLTEYCTVAPR